MSRQTLKMHNNKLRLAAAIPLAALGLAACGSGSSGGSTGVTSSDSGGSKSPGTSFSTANVSGLGQTLVDGSGKTVYILTKSGQKNVPCTDGSGCTAIWPDLSLPDGTSTPNAGTGVKSSLLGTMPANGETYPTYNGYLLYEYAADSGPGKANGEGIQSFGGTWYALNPAGQPITSASGSSGSSSGGYGGGYGS